VTSPRPRKFILNADDYGMDDAVGGAILELAGRGVVTSTSALVLFPGWREAGKRLAQTPLSRGLHLDFTSPYAADNSRGVPITALVMSAYSRRLDRGTVRRSIEHQLRLYEDVIGERPQFIDGHQHVHQAPMIRDELFHCLHERYGEEICRLKIRICLTKTWRGIEAAFVGATGAGKLKRHATAAGLSMNSDFAGVYSFSETSDLARLWKGWLATAERPRPIIICHPARPGDSMKGDPIRSARLREYGWLGGSEFQDLCAEAQMAPAAWS